ncbi:MAG: hypothetical protein WCQ21_18030 [Verrucomicrobiota bacterium]
MTTPNEPLPVPARIVNPAIADGKRLFDTMSDGIVPAGAKIEPKL